MTGHTANKGSPRTASVQPRSVGGSGSGLRLRPTSRATGMNVGALGRYTVWTAGIAGGTRATGSAHPILAMQSRVRPSQGFSGCCPASDLPTSDWAVSPIISAQSSLIPAGALVCSDICIGSADANAASWANKPRIAPIRSSMESQRFIISLSRWITEQSIRSSYASGYSLPRGMSSKASSDHLTLSSA